MTEPRDKSIEQDALLVIADIIRGMQDGSRTPWAITDAAVFMGHLRRRGLVVTTKERAEVGEAVERLPEWFRLTREHDGLWSVTGPDRQVAAVGKHLPAAIAAAIGEKS